MTLNVFIILLLIYWLRQHKMANIFTRPLDFLICVIFFNFLIIAATIDYTQTIYGSILAEEDITPGVWPPVPVLKAYAWWCEKVDPLLGHNPSWYAIMASFSTFLYCPFYMFAIYAFIRQREWIRIPALLWGWGLLLTMVVVLHEQFYGPYPTKDPFLFSIAYGGYALVPLMVMGRVARTPLFTATNTPPTQGPGNGGKKKKQKSQ